MAKTLGTVRVRVRVGWGGVRVRKKLVRFVAAQRSSSFCWCSLLLHTGGELRASAAGNNTLTRG